MRAWDKILDDMVVFECGVDDVWRKSKAGREYLVLLREQALALEALRLVTRADWQRVFPVRRWEEVGPHTTIARVGWWHWLRRRRWKVWQRIIEEARPVGIDVRLGLCLW